MKAAGEKRDEQGGHGMGKGEEMLGKVAGCEGMVKEGEKSQS